MSDCAKKECIARCSNNLKLKIDPGSKTTGLAIIKENKIIWVAELNHRGSLIKKKLDSRRQFRRNRRSQLRYRKPRFLNRTRPDRWLAPSLLHRVLTIMTWVKRLIKGCSINSIAMELFRFDSQKLDNPEISGNEYQQGELAGYEVREYLIVLTLLFLGKKLEAFMLASSREFIKKTDILMQCK